MAVKSIMIVGVGGQGTLLASRLLGSALLSKGYDVKVSEVHGMSQRGGSVVTYVIRCVPQPSRRVRRIISLLLSSWRRPAGCLISNRMAS